LIKKIAPGEKQCLVLRYSFGTTAQIITKGERIRGVFVLVFLAGQDKNKIAFLNVLLFSVAITITPSPSIM
jgi:hypothetical protein